MESNKYLHAVSVLLFLSFIATLFPPFNLGSERLKTQKERMEPLNEILPIKQYDFLFCNSKQEIFVWWGFDHSNNRSTRVYLVLERHLIVEELLLNYLLCILIATAILLFTNKLKPLFKRKKNIITLIIIILSIIAGLSLYDSLLTWIYKKVIVSEESNNFYEGNRNSRRIEREGISR